MEECNSYNIYDIGNYKQGFKSSQYKHFSKLFIELINEFLLHLNDKILLQNQSKYYFVMQRGIETMTHIFNTLLLYTQNIELTIFHCKRAYIYYVEFIGQIGDDKNTYLQLNSKDATLFVYKKTIFEINNDYRKTFTIPENDKSVLEITKKINNIYKKILMYLLTADNISIANKDIVIPFSTKASSKIVEKFLNYNMPIQDLLIKLDIYIFFVETMENKGLETIKFTNIMECFVKKLKKVDISKKELDDKIYSNNFNTMLNNHSPYKFVVWLYG